MWQEFLFCWGESLPHSRLLITQKSFTLRWPHDRGNGLHPGPWAHAGERGLDAEHPQLGKRPSISETLSLANSAVEPKERCLSMGHIFRAARVA